MKMKFDTEASKYKGCSYCDIQLKDSQYNFFYEHINDNKLICNDEECMRDYLKETHSRQNLILPVRGNPFKE